MLVKHRMTRTPVTVTPDDTLAHALSLTREHGIRHLPVVAGGDHLVGILSDRDIRLAMPSPLAVADWDRAAFLERTPVAAVMTRKVMTITAGDPIEDAAKVLYKHRIGCLPVVDERDCLQGVVTGTDILHAFVHLLGGTEQSSRIAVALEDEPGELARAIHVIGVDLGINIVSVVVPASDAGERKAAILHLRTIDPREAVDALRSAGFEVGWPSLEDVAAGAAA